MGFTGSPPGATPWLPRRGCRLLPPTGEPPVPARHVARVLPARKFSDTQKALLVAHGRLGSCPAERASGGEQLRKPSLIIGIVFVLEMLFEAEARCL